LNLNTENNPLPHLVLHILDPHWILTKNNLASLAPLAEMPRLSGGTLRVRIA
jgi:hypothetical protein